MDSFFAERVKLVRTNKGLTQEDIANALKIGRSTFCQYEKGTRKPDLPTIIKISEYLGISADYLLGISDDPNGKITHQRVSMYHQISGLLREYFSDDLVEQSEKDKMFKDVSVMYWKYKK